MREQPKAGHLTPVLGVLQSSGAFGSSAGAELSPPRRQSESSRGLEHSKTQAHSPLLLFALVSLIPTFSPAEDPLPPPPEQREIWIPTDQLAQVLKQHPKAVLLSRDEYETLLRDAHPEHPLTPAAPRPAVLASATYKGQLSEGVLTVTGALSVQVLTDDWVQLPLTFSELFLGSVTVEGQGAFAPKPDQAQDQPILLLRGRGERKVAVTFSVPVQSGPFGSHVAFTLPRAGVSNLQIDLPAHSQVTGLTPARLEDTAEKTHVTLALPVNGSTVDLTWRPSANALGALAPRVQSATRYLIDAVTARGETSLSVTSAVGVLPPQLDFTLPPDATVAQVRGAEVASWSATPGHFTVVLQPGQRTAASLELILDQPSLAGAPEATVALARPILTPAGPVTGTLTVIAGDGLAVREIATDAATAPRPAGADQTVAGEWTFTGNPAPPKVLLQRLRPRFSADLDTLVDFQREAIFLERTVTLHEEEGRLFTLLLTLPAGEEVLSVRTAAGAEPDWRPDGQRIVLHWSNDDLPAGQARTFIVRTRVEPAGWAETAIAGAGEKPLLFPIADARVEGAERVTGYIALRADENLRLEAEASETLERRDGRTTPIKGAYAWFRRDDYSLRVKVQHRPGELAASLTGYALPLAGVVDLHAHITWTFLHAGARSVQVKVHESAAQFTFDGPQIASRTRDGDTWTITFQKEMTGTYALGVEAQLPVVTPSDRSSTFHTVLPVIEPLHATRTGGTWAIEANTDTEVSIEAAGMNELDPLLAPALPGYQPRHRVIGVFSWLGPSYSLALSGARHAGAEVIGTVVDLLELQSVAGTSGAVRTDATIHLRTAGQQFLEVTLPSQASLLTLVVDGRPVKPVSGKAGDVRVELPAKSDPAAAILVRLLYEAPVGGEWRSKGRATLPALQLPERVPILHTTWHAFLPQGYYLSGWRNNLQPLEETPPLPLILAPVGLRRLVWAFFFEREVMASSGIGDPRAVEEKSPLSIVMKGRRGGLPSAEDQWQSQPGMIRTLPVPSSNIGRITAAPAATPLPAREPLANAAAMKSEIAEMQKKLGESSANLQVAPGKDTRVDRLYSSVDELQSFHYVGLLPMTLELPKAGSEFVFDGYGAPEPVQFHYSEARLRARHLWLWFLTGMAAFVIFGRRHPWWRACWATLLLTAYPLCLAPNAMATCNALLAGWLFALLWQRLLARLVFTPRPREVLA